MEVPDNSLHGGKVPVPGPAPVPVTVCAHDPVPDADGFKPEVDVSDKTADETLGKTHCPICHDLLNAKTARNMDGVHCITLACQHVVHQACWAHQAQGYLMDIAKAGRASKETTTKLRCPLCNTWNGPAGCEGTDEEIAVPSSNGRGHTTWRRPDAWWAQPVGNLMHQVLGYCYQQHCTATTKREGSINDEQVFVRRCKNVFQKARGGQQIQDNLATGIAILTKHYPKSDAVVPGQALEPIVDLLTDSFLLHVADSKKGKLVKPAEAKRFMEYYELWLMTAGFTKIEIAAAKVSWLRRHPELKC